MMKKNILTTILFLLTGAITVHAETLLFEDFEGSASEISARWPGQSYTGFPNAGGPMSLSTSVRYGGNQSIRMNFEGTQADSPPRGGGSAEQDYYPLIHRDIWLTWYSYMEAGFKTAGGNGVSSVATKGLYSYMKSVSSGEVHGWVFHYFYGGRQLTLSAQGIKDHKGPNGPGTGTAIPYDTENMWQNIQSYSQPDNQWVKYEAHFKLNTPGQADGMYELYITPAGASTFLSAKHANREFVDSGNTPSTAGNPRMPGDSAWYRTKLYRQDGLGYMYYDNISVTTTRLGSTGNPPPPPPPPPPPVSANSAVQTVAADSSGANLTFNGAAYKVRYWNDSISQANATEVSGLNGVTSYRHNINLSNTTFQCYQAQGSNGIWETNYICGSASKAKPRSPTGLRVLN